MEGGPKLKFLPPLHLSLGLRGNIFLIIKRWWKHPLYRVVMKKNEVLEGKSLYLVHKRQTIILVVDQNNNTNNVKLESIGRAVLHHTSSFYLCIVMVSLWKLFPYQMAIEIRVQQLWAQTFELSFQFITHCLCSYVCVVT